MKLNYYGIPIMEVAERIKANNNDVGGRKFEQSDIGYIIRGLGYIKNIREIENITLKTANSIPVKVRDVAAVQMGGELRLASWKKTAKAKKWAASS